MARTRTRTRVVRNPPIKLVVVPSDFHFGSTVGLCSPLFETDEGSGYVANDIQGWLWECWTDAIGPWLRGICKRDPFALVINGDMIEGRHHGTMQLIHHDIEVHKRLASHVIKPLADRASKTYVVRGTEVHTRTSEDAVAEQIEARPDPTTKRFCWEQLQLRVDGLLCHFKHHMGSSLRPWTSAAGLGVSLAIEQQLAVEYCHEAPTVVVRSHRHKFGLYQGPSGLIVATPPWQMLTRFARQVTQASLAVPGIVVLDFRGRKDGEMPRVHSRLYYPEPDVVVQI